MQSSSTEPSVFTKILNGDIPGEIIYQDDHAFVVLSIEPLSPGHLLVIPRAQIDSLWDVDEFIYRHLMNLTKDMSHLIMKAYDYQRVGMIVEGFGVPHAHIHLFGLNELLAQTVIRQAATKHALSQDEIKIEADKLRACL